MTFNQNLYFKKQKFSKYFKFGGFTQFCSGVFSVIFAKFIWQISKKKIFKIANFNKIKFQVKQISKFLLLNNTNCELNKRKTSRKVSFLLLYILENRQICGRNFEI